MQMRPRYTNEELKARLILVVGVTLALSFIGTLFSLVYGLLFVSQPLEISPNDESAWSVVTPMILFMNCTLCGVLASNGLKDKKPDDKYWPLILQIFPNLSIVTSVMSFCMMGRAGTESLLNASPMAFRPCQVERGE